MGSGWGFCLARNKKVCGVRLGSGFRFSLGPARDSVWGAGKGGIRIGRGLN